MSTDAFRSPSVRAVEESRWKVKIRDRERLEPPHVTILYRRWGWRMDLRTGRFLDVDPDPGEVPEALVREIRSRIAILRREWNRIFPDNPVP